MGRSSKFEAEKTRQKIIDAAFEITLDVGFKSATLKKISDKAGISSSAINAHFKRKEDIAKILAPIFMNIVKSHLVFDSNEDLYKSWKEAMDKKGIFSKVILNYRGVIPKGYGIKELIKMMKGDHEQILETIYSCLGYSFFHTSDLNKDS